MTMQFAFRQMASSEALKEYAEEKIQKSIERMYDRPISVRVVFSLEGGEHLTQCNVQIGNGNQLRVSQKSTNMYKSINQMVDKLDAQMRKLDKQKSFQRISKDERWSEKDSQRDEDHFNEDENDFLMEAYQA